MRLLQHDPVHGYELYRSDLIVTHHAAFVERCHYAVDKFKRIFGDKSSTWTFGSYNTFAMTAGSDIFYQLYHELRTLIRHFTKINGPLWFQSWLNFHFENEVLDWHRHRNSIVHGYISIEPHQTKTLFESYEIQNEIGNVYIAPSGQMHKVMVLERFTTPRITIAFDVFNEDNIAQMYKENKHVNLSVMPL
jgi:hypothetical protein